ncbi:hypothetical protein LCGC14_0437000 [marine sediment metagenome]|uniref:Uncharacterized protein n=1 Tax=marine sediment metagenome TaxID=412755 RepID=A0A0F9V8L2_9ZZZZ
MSAIHAVLLVPEYVDPHGLLQEGPCGARPPTLKLLLKRRGDTEHQWLPHSTFAVYDIRRHTLAGRHALVLAWDGRDLWQARPWLERAARRADCKHWRHLKAWLDEAVFLGENINTLVTALTELGTPVLLDADGLEVTP